MGEEQRVSLRDGLTVVVRPVRPGDRDLFASGFERMSHESRVEHFEATPFTTNKAVAAV